MKALLVWLLAIGAAAAADLAGKWNFVWDTPGGERRGEIVFTVEGEKVTADMSPSAAKVSGTFKNDVLELSGSLHSTEAGQEGTFKLNGRMKDGKLRGTASWNEHAMTFTASRAE